MLTVVVDLTISADEMIKRYRFPGAVVVCQSRDGRKVQFPASILQSFVSHNGITGSFVIEFDETGKFQSIKRL